MNNTPEAKKFEIGLSFIGEDAKPWFRSNQDALANPRIVSWDDLKREMRKQFSSTRMRHGRVEKLCID